MPRRAGQGSARTRIIALDLAQVTFLDCSGRRALIAFAGYVQASGGSVLMAVISREVARLFELVGQCDTLPPEARRDCHPVRTTPWR
jgi:anti-anti-sigma factor